MESNTITIEDIPNGLVFTYDFKISNPKLTVSKKGEIVFTITGLDLDSSLNMYKRFSK